MVTPDPIDGLDDEERQLLIKALSALRYVRGRAWLAACHAADEAEKRPPALKRYDLALIQRLARRLGGSAKHCTEWDEPL